LISLLAAGGVEHALQIRLELRRILEPERVDRHARDLEAQRVAPDLRREVELLDDLLVADRPADIGSEREPDLARDLGQL
jgi:hypothetical protein